MTSKLSWPIQITKPNSPSLHPRRTVYISPSLIVRVTYTDPSTIDTDGISVSHAGASSAGTTEMVIGGALASGGVATLTPPRNVVITVTHGTAVVAMSGTITGTDEYGNVITEVWAVTASGTTKTFTGVVAFKTITSITETIAATAAANAIIAGDGKVLGLPFKTSSTKIISELEDGAAPTVGAIVKASATANTDRRGTYIPNSTLNGALDFDVWYLVDSVDLQ